MKNHFTSLFSVLVFILKNNYLTFLYLFVPLLIKENKNAAYVGSLIMIGVSILLVVILPKKVGDVNYFERVKKSVIPKIAFVISQLVNLILNVTLVAYTIGKMFFYNYSNLIFLLATVIVVIYISTNKNEVIFNSSTFLYLVSIFLIIMPVFLAIDVKDFTLLKPFNGFGGGMYWLVVYFILDGVFIYLTDVKIKGKITKSKIIIPLLITFIFMSLEIINIIIITGNHYLVDNEFLGFFTLFIQDTINYIGNLGLFFLFVIPVVGCFKAGYSLRNIKDILNIKDTLLLNIILSVIFFFLSYLVISLFDVYKVSMLLVVISSISLFICYLFIIINRSLKYEIIF